ncbi:hypothetical protein [Cellulomonas gilvus]|uniref:Uncharacterized protein n=1 Tax=Cellulomonas gilvus (strain ATCC 13127 / NRRL B-14078) TaxID=593907 RepID=F8A2C1_CELGA|nr:hypothetical protein [Cellulomonas gilvus]AEI11778.1 hypothetical protein Celgi_1259 [Cellulomonas gilvus ATCC 13127]
MSTDLRPDRELAEHAARVTPAMSLDPGALLDAAHRHVRRRAAVRVGAGIAAVAVVAAAAVTVPRLERSPDPAQTPAPRVTTAPRPLGTGPVTLVAQGLSAVNRPAPPVAATGAVRQVRPDADMRMDLGLTAGVRELVLLTGTDDTGPASGWAGFVAADEEDGSWITTRGGGTWTWDAQTMRQGRRLTTEARDGRTSDVVVVPTSMPRPHVLLWSTGGFTDRAGGQQVAVELPTFAAPGGQLLAATLADTALSQSMAESTTGVVFVGTDGRVVEAPCEPADETQGCPAIEEVPGLVAAIDAFRTEPDRAQTTSPAPGAATTTRLGVGGVTWPTGLDVPRTGGSTGHVELSRATSAELDAAEGTWGVPAEHGLRVTVDPLSGAGNVITWSADDSPDRFAPGSHYPGSLSWAMDDDLRVLVGAVPAWMAQGRVLMWFPRGLVADDGTRVQAVEVPTFDDPSGSGARLYAVQLDEAAVRHDPEGLLDALVLAVDPTDGDVFSMSGSCRGLSRECLDAQPDGGAGLLAALRSAGADLTGAEPGAGVTPPAGPSSATTVADGTSAATKLRDDDVLDLGELDGERVWLRARTFGDTWAPLLFRGDALQQGQPGERDLTSPGASSSTAALDGGRGVVRLGVSPGAGAWRAFVWLPPAAARGGGAVELPTVELRGRRVTALLAQAPSELVDPSNGVSAWVSPDGEVVVEGCEGLGEAECEAAGRPGVVDDVRAAWR